MKKKFIPNKYVSYLYLFIPLIINVFIDYSSNEDIWYIMRYGKLILQNGFMHTDILSIHSNLHVIQQSFSNIIFYLIYHHFGSYGFFILCELITALYLFIIYKICMLLSEKNSLLSIIISTITTTLIVFGYMTVRPQIFTYLNLMLVIYIMEKFNTNNKSKLIYFLPLISLVQINLHAALWCSIFLFILPYIAEMIIKKNKEVYKILIIMIIMFLIGFINPYTYENVFFPILTYSPTINNYILELMPINIASQVKKVKILSIGFYAILSIIILIYIYYKKGKLELRHLLLLCGTTILALMNIRSIPFFLIGGIIPLANYLKKIKLKQKNDYIDTKWYWIILTAGILVLGFFHPDRISSSIKKGGDFLKKNYDDNIVIYTNLNYGSYIEYLGFHSYFDTRAEVFLKKANHKEDIFDEAIRIQYTCQDYKDFMKKYKFTHAIVDKDSCLYNHLKNDNEKIIFKEKEYVIFELYKK